MGPLSSTTLSRILKILITTEISLDWIANAISLWPARVETCNGNGGTAKWLPARLSLQSPLEEQILSVRQLFNWCMCNIQHATFYSVTAAEIDSQRELLDDGFASVRTIPWTQNSNSLVPLFHIDMKVSRVWRETANFVDKQINMDVHAVQGPTSCLSIQAHMLLSPMMDPGG